MRPEDTLKTGEPLLPRAASNTRKRFAQAWRNNVEQIYNNHSRRRNHDVRHGNRERADGFRLFDTRRSNGESLEHARERRRAPV